MFNHVNDLSKVFVRCMRYKLRMNLLKYAFGACSRNSLSIKGRDLDQIKAKVIQNMGPLTTSEILEICNTLMLF